jgi:hypothetical protein
MRSFKLTIIFFGICLLQSCLFGVGLVEKELTEDFWLIANNTYEDLEIYYSKKEASVYNVLVEKTVYSVGYNKDFIIAKSHPVSIPESTYYHIIETNKVRNGDYDKVPFYTLDQFNYLRKKLKIPNKLKFTIDFEDKLSNVKKTVNSY